MAGIGFELRKLFQQKGLLSGLKAGLFSTAITVGPTLLCILMLTIVQELLSAGGVGHTERELFMAAITYSFLFSLIMTGGWTMLLARYISDKLYNEELRTILPSYRGALIICLAAGGAVGALFYYHSPLGFYFKLAAYLLFMELNIVWIQMVYVSALREYSLIVRGFLAGILVSLALAALFVRTQGCDQAFWMLLAVNAGFFIILFVFAVSINRFFTHSDGNYFEFIGYLDRYPSLFLIGAVYALGLYSHNIAIWSGGYRVQAASTYYFAPLYDLPAFWAFFSVIPSLVTFPVSCETSFFEKYTAYYQTICRGGRLHEIRKAGREMTAVLRRELTRVTGFQAVFSFVALILGIILLPEIGFTAASLRIFAVMIPGFFFFIVMFILFTVLLYFDDRRGALTVMAIFAAANTLLTVITIRLGPPCYGWGFTAAAALGMASACLFLRAFLRNIEYRTFCAQSLVQIKETGFFTKLSVQIYRLIGK